MAISVYYLDDEPELLELFSDLISSDEIIVRTFSDPKLALEAILARPPDLLFLDYRLPNTTGDKIALQLDPKIPKILITGDLEITLEANFTAILHKPFSSKDVKTLIETFKNGPTKA